MQKLLDKVLLILFVLLALPNFASAYNCWSVARSASPATAATSLVPPRVFGTYSSVGNTLFIIAPNAAGCATKPTTAVYTVGAPAGSSLSSLKIDGVTQATTLGAKTITKGALISHSITAVYNSTKYLIDTTPSAGGSVSPDVQVASGGSVAINIIPNSGYAINSIIVDGSALTGQDLANAVAAQAYTFSNVTAGHTLTAVFAVVPTLSAAVSGSATIQTTTTTTLTASAASNVGPITYLWTVSPAGPTLATPTAASTTFLAATVGTYTVTMTASAPGATDVVRSATVVVQSAGQQGVQACLSCHSDGSLNTPQVPGGNGFLASTHYTKNITCDQCHSPGNTQHPYKNLPTNPALCKTCHSATFTTYSTTVHKVTLAYTCANCHGPTHEVAPASCESCHSGSPSNHPIEIGGNACTFCHNPHSLQATVAGAQGAPHYNNITSGMYPASYVTSKAECANCHNSNSNNQTIRKQWAQSGHADTTALPWIDYDFKTRVECVRCHTTTGFIAYSSAKATAAWGVATDKTKEVLTCIGCHSDVASGAVRTVTPNKPYADETSFTNHNVGDSNICMDCHTGRNNGTSIQVKVGTADFSNLAFSTVSPHYLSAGGSLQGKSGYHFRTYADYSSNSHRKVGMTNNNSTGINGPCVACHMSAPNRHAFKAVSSASGAIVAITTTVCTNCHNSSLPAAVLDAKRAAFNNALDVLKVALQDKGFVYSPNYPYFASKNWGTGQAGANVLGAAFNYKLFASEPGAYAHNPEYAKQLITDSIEAVVRGGTVTGSDISSYLNDLYGAGKITADQITSLNNYKTPENSCNSCHGNPPATQTHSAVSPGTCANCHTYTGPGSDTHNNGTVDVNMTCNSCHGNPPTALTVAHSGHTGTHTTATDCATCHGANPGAPGHNNGILATTCVACHGNPPTALTIAISGHTGTHTTATDCVTCHGANPGAAGHNDGSLTTTCVACHGNPPTTQTIHVTGAVQYTHSTPATDYTDCTICHESTHKNGSVDLKTNDNACSSCHSYPPTSPAHTTATAGTAPNCVTCHTDYTGYSVSSHNNGTLNVSGDLGCDLCHGYPPMTAAQLGTKEAGTFVNAKVEDYAGGGAFHSSHLLPAVTAAEGFTPCLPCHPSGYHNQGSGTVVQANVNVFDAADTSFRLNAGLPKLYDSVATTCSNISCHFKASPAWKQ